MSEISGIMVFIEHTHGRVAGVSLELLCKAGELANELNTYVTAVTVGHRLKDELEALGAYGCSKVYYIDDQRLEHFTSIPFARNVAAVIKNHTPQIVLFGATTMGRDIAPRVASELKCGLTADCTDLQIGDHDSKGSEHQNRLLQIRPAFGGNIIATIVSTESFPSMATVRPGVMAMKKPEPERKARVLKEKNVLTREDYITEVIDIIDEERKVNLQAARIIVSAGMGAASGNGLELVRNLAETLGGELGSSRPMVDLGYLPKVRQVGQTGTTVRPNLYIACGISGQIQHRAGMSESSRIIAINTDPDAPIFKIAHYGIVGDLNNVIPRMIKAYKEKT